MDFSKFKTTDWLVAGGGAVVFIGGFLNWLTAKGFGGSYSGGNAFDFTFTGALPWLLCVAAAVITVLLVLEIIDKNQLPWPMIILAATGFAALLLLIRVVFNPGVGDGVDRGIGMILTFLGGVVASVGGFMNFQASGGELSDLTDMDKIKESFGGSGNDGGDMPPPPPAGGNPPPPPPPPA